MARSVRYTLVVLAFRSGSRLLVLLLTTVATAVPALADGTPRDAAAATRSATFETVWRIVDEKFYDPSFNGVDWKAVHERYAPLVAATTSDADLYPLLNRMLGELKASHFVIRPPDTAGATTADPQDASWGGDCGMTVRLVEDRPTVTDVAHDGPAEAAGLRPGYVVTRVGTHVLADVRLLTKDGAGSPVVASFRFRRAVQTLLAGMPGSRIEIGYFDGGDAPGVATLVRRESPGRPLTFGALPTVLARVETRRLAGGVGYLRFNIFMPDLMSDVRAALATLADAPAIVVDLRDNPGGVGLMAPSVASLFLSTVGTLGTMRLRRGEIRFVTYAQDHTFTRPLVILVDEATASTSEIFAGALQESGRAIVVGQRTLGAVLPSVVERLPNGAVFQYAVADFRTPKGVLLEGRGVHPDVEVTIARSELLAGHDPTLDAALGALSAKGAPNR